MSCIIIIYMQVIGFIPQFLRILLWCKLHYNNVMFTCHKHNNLTYGKNRREVIVHWEITIMQCSSVICVYNTMSTGICTCTSSTRDPLLRWWRLVRIWQWSIVTPTYININTHIKIIELRNFYVMYVAISGLVEAVTLIYTYPQQTITHVAGE